MSHLKRVAWITDPHFDFLPSHASRAFGQYVVKETGCDSVILTGDISICPTVSDCLSDLADGLGKPLYFVLGNHDFYLGSFEEGRKIAERFQDPVIWLSKKGVIGLTETTALVGHDGWYDAQHGNPYLGVRLSDFEVISDLSGLPRMGLVYRFRQMGQKAAEEAEPALREALAGYRDVVFATHVPPFKEACWHEGRISSEEYLPWFTCKAIGDLLLSGAEANPSKQILVLCGHSHGWGKVEVLPNLKVLTGGACYGSPAVAHVFDFSCSIEEIWESVDWSGRA